MGLHRELNSYVVAFVGNERFCVNAAATSGKSRRYCNTSGGYVSIWSSCFCLGGGAGCILDRHRVTLHVLQSRPFSKKKALRGISVLRENVDRVVKSPRRRELYPIL